MITAVVNGLIYGIFGILLCEAEVQINTPWFWLLYLMVGITQAFTAWQFSRQKMKKSEV